MFAGTPKDPGILPRVLDATFQHMEGRQYEGMDLKPYLRNDVQHLDPDQVKQERSSKAAIFTWAKEVRQKPETQSARLCPEVMPSLSSRNMMLPDPVGVPSPGPACPPRSRLPVCPAISPVKPESLFPSDTGTELQTSPNCHGGTRSHG